MSLAEIEQRQIKNTTSYVIWLRLFGVEGAPFLAQREEYENEERQKLRTDLGAKKFENLRIGSMMRITRNRMIRRVLRKLPKSQRRELIKSSRQAAIAALKEELLCN